MAEKMNKILVILGPTASGKSDLAVKLATKFDGEIISADSRQVYKGMNIGTGKITKKEMSGIPHHMLDIASPKKTFTVQDFKEKAEVDIKDILERNKVPIICGGTGFYIQSIVDNISFPEVLPNLKLRRKLGSKDALELFALLKKLDPDRAKNIDSKNPRRLIRAIEIASALGKVPVIKPNPIYSVLQIGIQTEDKILKDKIHKRLISRFKKGMIAEVSRLHKNGVTWRRLEELGLEYRYVGHFLQNKISKQDMAKQLERKIWHYAKRQMTWFKRDRRIKWHFLKSKSDIKRIEKRVRIFLK